MNLILQRIACGPDGVFGRILDEAGKEICVSLERAYRTDDGSSKSYAPKIPPGTYVCNRRHSLHFGFDVFELQDVPGHTNIEIHPANWETDLDGCIGVGKAISGQMITKSRDAFSELMRLLEGQDTFTLEVRL